MYMTDTQDRQLRDSIRYYKRGDATAEDFDRIFSDPQTIEYILTATMARHRSWPKWRGEFVEFLRQEFLQLSGWTLYDKHNKPIADGKNTYAGADRTDVRAAKFHSHGLIEILSETCKIKKGKAIGVGTSEVEGAMLEGVRLRGYVNNGNPVQFTLGVVCSDNDVTNDLNNWYSKYKLEYDIHELVISKYDEIRQWAKVAGKSYEKYGDYRPQRPVQGPLSDIELWFHQERLQARWTPRLLNDELRLLVVWGCRTGKTFGSLALLKDYAEKAGIQLNVAICCSLPALFPDWEESIRTIFGDTAVIHRHRSKSEPVYEDGKHMFVLSSAQMLNEQKCANDKEKKEDKKSNKKVMFTPVYNVLIYDEGHLSLTADNTYKQVIGKIKHSNLIGLTATPFRDSLLDTSIFAHRDTFDYWQQMELKEEGHPDYQSVAERFIVTLQISEQAKRIYKNCNIDDIGVNIQTVYTDSTHMNAMLYLLWERVLNPAYVLKDSKHQVRDVIIKALDVSGGKTLLDAMRDWVHPVTGKKCFDNHLIGLATGSKSDLPGIEAGYKGISADNFKLFVGDFFGQNTKKNYRRRVLIVVEQGLVGHTFKSVNTTIDLSNGQSLMTKYQFWDRGGSQYIYPDGYKKETYYHFDFNFQRILEMGEEMRKTIKSDPTRKFDDRKFFERLNWFDIEDGVNMRHVNETVFKEELEKALAQRRLGQILPKSASIIANDDAFADMQVTKLKNGFGNTTIGEAETDILKKAGSKRIRTTLPTNNPSKTVVRLDKNTVNAVERVVNVLPVLAILKNIADRKKKEA